MQIKYFPEIKLSYSNIQLIIYVKLLKIEMQDFCQGGSSNINQCGFMYRTSFNKSFCYRACVQGKQYFWYIKIKYRIRLDDK